LPAIKLENGLDDGFGPRADMTLPIVAVAT